MVIIVFKEMSDCVCLCVLGKGLREEGRAGGETNSLLLFSYRCLVPRKVLGEQSYMNGTHESRILLC